MSVSQIYITSVVICLTCGVVLLTKPRTVPIQLAIGCTVILLLRRSGTSLPGLVRSSTLSQLFFVRISCYLSNHMILLSPGRDAGGGLGRPETIKDGYSSFINCAWKWQCWMSIVFDWNRDTG